MLLALDQSFARPSARSLSTRSGHEWRQLLNHLRQRRAQRETRRATPDFGAPSRLTRHTPSPKRLGPGCFRALQSSVAGWPASVRRRPRAPTLDCREEGRSSSSAQAGDTPDVEPGRELTVAWESHATRRRDLNAMKLRHEARLPANKRRRACATLAAKARMGFDEAER